MKGKLTERDAEFIWESFPSKSVKRKIPVLTALDAAVAFGKLYFPPSSHFVLLKGSAVVHIVLH